MSDLRGQAIRGAAQVLQPAVMRSTSANSSAENCQFPAFTFCSNCSGRVAPAMTLATGA